jgi:hypothetical protein
MRLLLCLIVLVGTLVGSASGKANWQKKYEKAQEEIVVLKRQLEESKAQIHVRYACSGTKFVLIVVYFASG